jgi:hypothetical protein
VASVKKVLIWLFGAVVCYPIGCCGFVATCEVADSAAEQEPRRMLARVPTGGSPDEVEAVFGRPAEYVVRYARVGDTEQYSHNWTVNSYRLEVVFVNGRSSQRHTFPPSPGPVRQFFGWVFFWWLAGALDD